MKNDQIIPYDLVATKMNHWYNMIKMDWESRANRMKEEVEKELQHMEENQDVLVYYSLLEFRHEMMIAYKTPNAAKGINDRFKQLKQYEGEVNLTGMLEYYYYFFMGMYYFRQKELTYSLDCYRKAENFLNTVDFENAEIERAEFYFKLAEVCYHMKQTYFSMNNALRAYEIFKKQPFYGVMNVRCQFVIFGNLLDSLKTDEALKQAYKAYKDAKELGNHERDRNHLIRSALFNKGLCYNHLEEPDKSFISFHKSLQITEPENNDYFAKTLFVIAFLKGKQNDTETAWEYYNKSKYLAESNGNEVVMEKLKMVKGLFLSDDLDLVRETFQFFKKNKSLYPDMESYAISVAELLARKKDSWGAIEFYRLANEARIQIKRGESI
ncbi:RapH N-terminal domain-containing protein [Bacillus velezensis]|uniref:response regulator aspartate phosphatase n=1 Tax=Bacillus velezensis TaxID=492670 RepID=UPI000CE03FCB|nr:RapH N-terminal domain-containing protein [Bacillus velezensis]AVB11397.1 aspartate phosphatase [Bacillus velezensis]MEC0382658.1 RapH N-terminal domain-containing protein [Bacillus velezensis]MEC0388020.1 RapH N-terminal domain-containing protein [Bacillus velezensis]